MNHLPLTSVLIALAFAPGCSGTTDIDGDSGGTSSASGADGQTSGAGGGQSGSGNAPSSGGADDLGGAAGEGDCPCASESTITVELPSGTRTYDLAADNLHSCWEPTCDATTPIATWGSLVPGSAYRIRGCRAEGDCIWIFAEVGAATGNDSFGISGGSEVQPGEPIAIDTSLIDTDGHQVLEFTFETTAESGVVATGHGRVCWADSVRVCLL